MNLRLQGQNGMDEVFEANGLTTEEILINLYSNQLYAIYNQDQMYNQDM